MIEVCREYDLKTGVILDSLNSQLVWRDENYTVPISFSSAAYKPQQNYYPICPSNPAGLEYFDKILMKMHRIPAPDYFYILNLRFPFFWQNEPLDIQNQVPPYCYCPFCITEFSSIVGEIINSGSQILDLITEWLEWRTSTIFNLFLDARELLPSNPRLIIALPPLSLIDLPFTTGQLPMAFTERGALISPQLSHRTRCQNYVWIEDMLEQYQFDIKSNKIMPCFGVSSLKDLKMLSRWEKSFPAILFSNWQTIKTLD
jgi:hypothetical protein